MEFNSAGSPAIGPISASSPTPTPTPTPTLAPTAATSSVHSESAAVSGGLGTLKQVVAENLSGQLVSRSRVSDSSASGFTETWTFITPGGTIVAQSGGANVPTPRTAVGKNVQDDGRFTIVSSTDPGFNTSHYGVYSDFSAVSGLNYASYGYWSFRPCSSLCLATVIGTYGGGAPGVDPKSSMPTTGSATYAGGSVGRLTQPPEINSNNGGNYFGTAELTANFVSGTISGAVTGIQV